MVRPIIITSNGKFVKYRKRYTYDDIINSWNLKKQKMFMNEQDYKELLIYNQGE